MTLIGKMRQGKGSLHLRRRRRQRAEADDNAMTEDELQDEDEDESDENESRDNNNNNSSSSRTEENPDSSFVLQRRSTAIRNIALWRMAFFAIMTFYELGLPDILTPFGSLDIKLDMGHQKPGKDRWFAYHQFEWLQDVHVFLGKDPQWADRWHQLSYLTGFLAAFGKELKVPGWRYYTSIFTVLYLIRFLVKGTNFTNHNYLFPLMMILLIVSGGGHISGQANKDNKRPFHSQVQSCQASIVATRAQFSILYGYASLWKLHGDWLAGRIVRSIFLSFQNAGKTPVREVFSGIFVYLAWGGLLLDASMFAVLTFVRPKASDTKLFLTITLMFHVFTSITMGKVIGYSFPGTCIAGLVLFLPLEQSEGRSKRHQRHFSYDQSLLEWLRFYWDGLVVSHYRKSSSKTPKPRSSRRPGQTDNEEDEKEGEEYTIADESSTSATGKSASYNLNLFVIGWTLWQFLFPLRMLYVSSGNFPYNRLGYRYSWTMMMHNDQGIIREHGPNTPKTVLLLSYLVPTCFNPNGNDIFVPRAVYMGPSSEHPMQDHRTVPLHTVLSERESAMLTVFPMHFVSRIAFGMAKIIDYNIGANACATQGIPQQDQMGMHAVYFSRLNQNGPFVRTIDPMVNLVSTALAQERQPYIRTLWNSFWDQRPSGHEFVLKGIGSLRVEALQKEELLKHKMPGVEVATISDRAACLSPRPLWLRSMGHPYMIVPLLLPTGMQLVVRSADMSLTTTLDDIKWKEVRLWPGQSEMVQTVFMEIGLIGDVHSTACGDTTKEDVLFAFVYKENI